MTARELAEQLLKYGDMPVVTWDHEWMNYSPIDQLSVRQMDWYVYTPELHLERGRALVVGCVNGESKADIHVPHGPEVPGDEATFLSDGEDPEVERG